MSETELNNTNKEQAMNELTHEQLLNKIKQYDNINNEGGEGYNPYRGELYRRQDEHEKNREKSLEEKEYAILKKKTSAYRSSGCYTDAEKEYLENLENELIDIRKMQHDRFLNTWTIETTKIRREEWNTFARAAMAKYSKKEISGVLFKKQREQGWTMEELKKAVKTHNL